MAASLTGTVGNSSHSSKSRQSDAPAPQQYDLLESAESSRELKPLEWRVRVHRRARSLSLHVEPNGSVRVTVPPRSRPRDVAAFVKDNAAWIEKAQHYFIQRRASQTVLPDNIALKALEMDLRVVYLSGARSGCEMDGDQLLVSSPTADIETCWPLLQAWLKRSAKRYLIPKINKLADEINLKPKRVQVRLQKSRWGSCSSLGTVSLNAALLLRPPEEVRYLLVHELCHLQHLDHSKRYWALVETHEPRYRALDQSLNAAWRDTPLWLGH